MNWLLGIGVEQNKLVAIALNEKGEQVPVPLENLVSTGTPSKPESQKKSGLVTELGAWKAVEPSKYLEAYDIEVPVGLRSEHPVYEFQVRDTKVQVPAIVLMRALFVPSKHVLPMMFKPQAMDDIGYLNGDDLEIQADWVKPGHRCMTEGIKSTLRWMFAFPSANEMANSVHENALRGRIDLKLPSATVRLSAHGKKIGNTYYATEIVVSKIIAQESPFSFACGFSSVVTKARGSFAKAPDESIPLRDYQVELSDSEWKVVQPVLLANARGTAKLSQRDLLDAILWKLHSGMPWRKVTYKSGSYVHASQAYRNWLERGTFKAALDLLRTMRQPA